MPRDSFKTKRVVMMVVEVSEGWMNQRLGDLFFFFFKTGLFSKTDNEQRQVSGKNERKLFTEGHLEPGTCQSVTHPSVVKSFVIAPA